MPKYDVRGYVFVVIALLCSVARADEPNDDTMQELFDLAAQRTRLEYELKCVERKLAQLEQEQFAAFTRVGGELSSHYSEDHSDSLYSAIASNDIKAGELLLMHAPGIYRVHDERPILKTEGECWYFRPDRDIAEGESFTIVPIHDAPEELANRERGFMARSQRARDPERAYETNILPSRDDQGR